MGKSLTTVSMSVPVRNVALSLSIFFLPVIAAVVTARADTGVSSTAGSDHFLYNDLNADIDVSSTVSVGAYYARFQGDFVPPTNIYSANISLQLKSASLSLDGYFSPESDGTSFYGAQLTGGYQAGSPDVKGDLSLSFSRALNLLHNAPGTGEMPLHQNLLSTSLRLTYRKTVSVRYLYSFYYYQENQVAYFNAQFGNSFDLPPIVYTIEGFPSRESLLGISWYPGDLWQFSFDWSRLLYETFDARQNSVIWGATFFPGRSWGITAGYNLINGTISYITLGIQWYTHGREPGTERRSAITYNNIP